MPLESEPTPVGAFPAKLYRAMRKDTDGQPRCGSEGNLLGVRTGVDIHPNR